MNASNLMDTHDHWLHGDGSGGDDYAYRIADATRDALMVIERQERRLAELERTVAALDATLGRLLDEQHP